MAENCWILAYDSDGTPADNGEFVEHFTAEAEARKRADGAWAAVDGMAPGYFAYTTPRQLDRPCLIVKCGGCGKAYDEEGAGRSVHFETVEDARLALEDEWTVLEDGTYQCEPCTIRVLSERIRQEREWVNYPPERMAAELGIPAGGYEAFESGEAVPTDDQLAAIAYLCGTTPARLQGEELRADPRLEQAMAGKDLTHDDVWTVHRFAELLRVRAAADQSGEAS